MTSKDLFEILTREHMPMLVNYLRCLTRDDNLVDDLCQESLLVAWRTLDRFDRSRPFGPWLRGIAAKLVLSHRRRQTRAFFVCNQNVLEQLDAHFAELQNQSGDTFEEKLAGLRDCLERLPAPYRQAIHARYWDGLTGGALAAHLQLSVENIKKRLQRGRDKLWRCLQQKLGLLDKLPAAPGGGA